MATNKNQHFVPRCYLRPFTVDAENMAINLYNIDRKKFIPNAPVKNQCSRDYFYGTDDQLEAAIQAVESSYAAVLRKILSSDRHVLDEEEKDMLKLFWLFQYVRTEAASRRSMEASQSFTELLKGQEQEYPALDIPEAVQLAMKMFAENMSCIDDLKVCLIKNNSKVPFVTSDDPAILTNRWYLQNRRKARSSFGLNRSGMLALLPLTPKIHLVAYDSDVYSLPHKDGWLSIRKDTDADALNQHQYMNGRANIFFKPPIDFASFETSFEKVANRRLPARHRITYAAYDTSDGVHSRYAVIPAEDAHKHADVIMHLESLHAAPLFWPSFLAWRHGATVYTNGTAQGYVRKAYAEKQKEPPFFFKQPAFLR